MTEQKDVDWPTGQPDQAHSGTPSRLTAHSSLAEALPEFTHYMRQSDMAENTIKSFQYDLHILVEYLGQRRKLGDVAVQDLRNFVDWLQQKRGVPCNIKSLARRITTLKVFFNWLAESHILPSDPAAALIQVAFSTPLPDILYADQVEQLLTATQSLRRAERPDPRPHLLVSLLLATGIKKGECMNLSLEHLDFSDRQQPAVWIRYANPRYQLKERKLKLDPAWPDALQDYTTHYTIRDKLFPCTARNLEYVLSDAGKLAALPKQVSFEMLRWSCAVRDFKAGMPPNDLRRKLGLSEITWREAGDKIARLAADAI